MLPDERLTTIAARLLERTEAGRQRWQAAPRPRDAPDDHQPREFHTRLESGTALIASAEPEGRYPYLLRLVDAVGVEAARIETGEDAESWLGDREADGWEQTLAGLYAAVRRSTIRGDTSVDAMLRELEAG